MPMGAYAGTDYFVYEVCDHGSPGNCSQAQVAIQVLPDYTNPCNEANLAKTYFLPFQKTATNYMRPSTRLPTIMEASPRSFGQ